MERSKEEKWFLDLRKMSREKKKKRLVIGFQNNRYFKSIHVIKKMSEDRSREKTTRLHHNETSNVDSDTSVRVRVQVKKGIKVFVIGGYYYLDNQYVIPKGSFGRIDFVVSGTVHYETYVFFNPHSYSHLFQ